MSILREITGLSRPQAVAVHGVNGNIFISDTGNRLIKKYNSSGTLINEWAIEADGEECVGLAFDNTNSLFALTQKPDTSDGGYFYEYDANDILIRKFIIDDYTLPPSNIGCFAFDKNNNMWLSERMGGSNGFKAYDITPKPLDRGYLAAPKVYTLQVPNQHGFIMGFAFDKNNNLYYTINGGGVYKYNFVNNSHQLDVADYKAPFTGNTISGHQSYGIALDASNKIAVMTQIAQTHLGATKCGIRIIGNLYGVDESIHNFGFGLFKFDHTGAAPFKYTHHCTMQVMPNGNILVPDFNNNRVCIIGSTAAPPPPLGWIDLFTIQLSDIATNSSANHWRIETLDVTIESNQILIVPKGQILFFKDAHYEGEPYITSIVKYSLTVKGTLVVMGIFTGSGIINNNNGGTIRCISGSFYSSNITNNSGTIINNCSEFQGDKNNQGGKIINNNIFTVGSGKIFENYNGATFINGGILQNNGIFNNYIGGTFINNNTIAGNQITNLSV